MSDKVLVFKSLNGMDYIGKLAETTDFVYKLKDVYAVVVHQNNEGGVQIAMGAAVHPALGKVHNNETVDMDVERGCVTFVYEPTDNLYENYVKRTSGIQTAKRMPGNL